jgi:hypothetical protein
MSLLQPFLNHLKVVICNENEESYNHELKKLGWIFQNPNSHLEFATVLLGEEGAGKGSYTDVVCDLWGPEWTNRNVNNMEMITEPNHAEVISWKKFIVCNEIKDMDHSRASWDVMKSRVTDHYYMVRLIYQASRQIRNVNNYFLCSNNYNSIKMGLRDRRYDIKEVSDKYVGKIEEYFIPLHASYTDEMKTHLLKFLLEMDITGFDHRIPPSSELKKEMQDSQRSIVQLFLEEFDWVDSSLEDKKEEGMLFQEIYKDGYLPYCDKYGVPERYRTAMQAFGMAIRPHVDQKTKKIEGKVCRAYFPKGSLKMTEEEAELKKAPRVRRKKEDGPQSIEVIMNGNGRVRKSAPVPDPESQASPDSEPAESLLQ